MSRLDSADDASATANGIHVSSMPWRGVPIGTVCSACWLAGPRHLTVTSPKIPCSSLLTSDHRKRNPNRWARCSSTSWPRSEFEVDLLRVRTREGMAVAQAKGKLRGKQPKLGPKQQTELRRVHGTGEDSINDLAELFSIGGATVYRTLQRNGGR